MILFKYNNNKIMVKSSCIGAVNTRETEATKEPTSWLKKQQINGILILIFIRVIIAYRNSWINS